ncbi:hypothetical protein Q8F57_018690 [Paraburkholderia terrae]|uniref:hypothetical protein n=1 Tax=Paraburkholderia terrae TaxID=311230 RepID=UPI00296B5706|nr:hypothetical protein [Paraburkholderia terrae]MDW3655126.1 hypothetical protein [Paraburkholderia terrae]
MDGNARSLGRNWYTADAATLVAFNDCARAELHWRDGATVYEIFDTRAEAIAFLNEHGFYEVDK